MFQLIPVFYGRTPVFCNRCTLTHTHTHAPTHPPIPTHIYIHNNKITSQYDFSAGIRYHWWSVCQSSRAGWTFAVFIGEFLNKCPFINSHDFTLSYSLSGCFYQTCLLEIICHYHPALKLITELLVSVTTSWSMLGLSVLCVYQVSYFVSLSSLFRV